MRRAGAYTTVLLSTGEAPAVSFTEDGGTRARALTIWGPPFGRADDTTAPVVHNLNQTLFDNYGHAGPRLVEYILANRSLWDSWADLYRQWSAYYTDLAGGNPVAGRLATYFAAIVVTAAIADEALALPWPFQDPVAPLWNDLVSEASEAEVALTALAYVLSWATGHQADFWGRHSWDREGNPRVSGWGWAGAWDSSESWAFVGFLSHRLTEVLRRGGFEPAAVLRVWRDRGYLLKDSQGRPRHQVRIRGTQKWTIAIYREAFEHAENVER